MLDDITILYYTAGVLPDHVAAKVRAHLFSIVRGLPIISVSQKPLDFGRNICVGDIGQSYYNCYKQILIGAKVAQTDFVICAEDDTLYPPEHFLHRPATNAFCYNKNMFYLEDEKFWHKWQTGMFACIAPAKLLIENLEARFAAAPVEPMPRSAQKYYWHEPGKTDGTPAEYFETKIPIITFNYFAGLGGKAKSTVHRPMVKKGLESWGTAHDLKKEFWNE